jgi:ribonuclease HI
MTHVIKEKDTDIHNVRTMNIVRFDGGSNPNPGPCAGAFVIYEKGSDDILAEGGCFISQGTNNIGEYTGLRIALERCIALGLKNIYVEGDSLLVISQVAGKWKVKNQILSVIHSEILSLLSHFDTVVAHHIRREFNSYADSLSDKTLALRRSW